MTQVKTRKKLIEVALPLEAINTASAREKSIRHGHPSTLHLYWARRPLATARAVIFAQMVDDPSANPDLFPTEKAQDKERQRLFRIIEDLVKWENTTNEKVLQAARDEIWASWRRACADNADHPQAKELFDRNKLPAFHDPFAGGGALPLEAQRLGLESYATGLNPVAVMINKAMIEIPPKFAGKPPVNPEARSKSDLIGRDWKGAQGIAEDVRYYGEWMRNSAHRLIGHHYPDVEVTDSMAKDRADLEQYVGRKLKVVAWIWARTVKSPNPAYSRIDVPLASTYQLSSKEGNEVYVDPVVSETGYSFLVKVGKPANGELVKKGTKSGSSGSSFLCLMSGVSIPFEYIRSEAKSGRMGARLMAVVVEGVRGRVYLSPTNEMESAAQNARPADMPDIDLPAKALGFRIQEYGMTKWRDLFTPRQLLALSTFTNLITDVRKQVLDDSKSSGLPQDKRALREGGEGAVAYADAISVYMAFAVDYAANYWSVIATPAEGFIRGTFARQAIPMTWDFAEAPPFGSTSGNWMGGVEWASKAIDALPAHGLGMASQADAARQSVSDQKVISTDPPYYDNIGYADLSDYFYYWLRQSLGPVFPDLFSTLAVPKAEELVATPYRHGDKVKAEAFFLDGMTEAMHRLSVHANSLFPVTIYYAFKQTENNGDEGVTNTGWDTFLAAVVRAGFSITGTWPVRTERSARSVGIGTNALASSVVLVCRKSVSTPNVVSRRDFITALKSELPGSLLHLQRSNIAPVDLAQAAIGPGIAVFTRYSKVIGADGAAMSVREALQLINQVLDEQLSEQEGNWDSDTRWGVIWFDQNAFSKGDFGQADQLAKAKNTSVSGVVQAGFVESGAGKVRLLKPEELPSDWSPDKDERLTVWEMLHQLIRLQKKGEAQCAAMLAKLGDKADAAKELAYRLYGICERKKRSAEGQLYNDLITVWPDLVARSKEAPTPTTKPGEFNLDS